MRFVLRFIGFAAALASLAMVSVALAVGFVLWHLSSDLPDHAELARYEPAMTTRLHAADGRIIAEYARENRLYLPLAAMPRRITAAFLSAEDRHFYEHNGIDLMGIGRALLANLASNAGRPQGASTITQQVAKNILLSREQTYSRKLKEILLAFRIEETFTKDRILELYLNEIYFGMGHYGIAAAALGYFDKSVHELSLAEIAYLAALPKGPNNYHPLRRPEAAMNRRNWVLERMAANGYIGQDEADVAMEEALVVNPRTVSPHETHADYFAEEVRRELANRYGEAALYEGGMSVRTTLDPKMQAAARKSLVDGLVSFDETRGWRGTAVRLPSVEGDWGLKLAELPTFEDIRPWRQAVVLSVDAKSARIGLRPDRDAAGEIEAPRFIGRITGQGIRWTGKSRMGDVLRVGDIVHVEPFRKASNEYRLRQIPEISGALVALEPDTGRIRAMVGGFSFRQNEFNRATQAWRQPGSTFKAIVYAAALDNGYTPSSLVLDAPLSITQGAGQAPWSPVNHNGRYDGPSTLRMGLERSKNVMTVRLARDIGMPLIADYARRLGVQDDLPPLLSMALGAGETTVLRMTTAYAMLVNGGRYIRPTLIEHIQDRHGTTIFRHDQRSCSGCSIRPWSNQPAPNPNDKTEQVIDPLTAYQVTSLLQGVVERTLPRVFSGFDRPLAGKTGTTNDARDLWFVGSTPELAVGVFLGSDRPRSMGKSAYGSGYAAPIARAFLEQALAGKPHTAFRVPSGIKLIPVDPYTGKRTATRNAILEAFKPGTEPPVAEPPAVADELPTGISAWEAHTPPGFIHLQ
ncbi:penicillin-binding protein 1A [Microvirga lotononidis]|uniref:Penicillin-binding protein 1A n=1 Tax=Microvirga lotononidis TaxID=864069 RepID=I4YZL8_9HYPH|nr:penicillin-binding protein 1A [Microvirga lotononidis]EIM29410.1 penicillin-binding protein, 1A family [Microvirga lotononidis]WQO27269.1 penicillin-binding protein 1A [Microvirga lotononidis]